MRTAASTQAEIPLGTGKVAYNGPYAPLEDAFEHEVRLGATDDDQGVLVAGVSGNRLIVFLSLEELFSQVDRRLIEDTDDNPCQNGNPAHQVFEEIFSQAMPVLSRNIDNYDWKNESEEYVRMKLAVLDRSITDWREEINRNQRTIEERTFEVMGLVTRTERLRESIKVFEVSTRMTHKRTAAHEYEAFVCMMKSGAVQDVSVSDSRVSFVTSCIDIDYDGYRYEFGPFRVELGLGNGEIKILPGDTAHTKDGYHHPHISSTGSPCLGNTAPVIAKSLGMGDVTGAVSTVLEFLRSYNPSDPYLRIERWNHTPVSLQMALLVPLSLTTYSCSMHRPEDG